MPSVPRFSLSQDEVFVYIDINVPYVRVSEMEFVVDGLDFTFYCKPYLLKLHFPHEVIDDDRAKGVYDVEKNHGTITVHLPKKEKGQVFEDLDMITKLMQPRRNQIEDFDLPASSSNLIEIMDSEVFDGNQDEDKPISDHPCKRAKNESVLLEIDEKMEDMPSIKMRSESIRYGFNNRHHNFFKSFNGELGDILSLPDPDSTPVEQRRFLREAVEDAQFSMERYLGDFLYASEDPMYQDSLRFVPDWTHEKSIHIDIPLKNPHAASISTPALSESILPPIPPMSERGAHGEEGETKLERDSPSSTSSIDERTITGLDDLENIRQKVESVCIEPSVPNSFSGFSNEEMDLLRRLPNREYLIAKGSFNERTILCGLVDILVGFAYDHRTTHGEPTVESGWAIAILSSTLSWLDGTLSMDEVTRTAFRRMLAYPYIRTFELSRLVLRDVVNLLSKGKRVVLRNLLRMHRIMEKAESRYLLCPLYVEDYCVWIQSTEDSMLLELSQELSSCIDSFDKDKLGWDILQHESTAMEAKDDPCEDEETSNEESASSSSEEETDSSSSSNDDDDDEDTSDEDDMLYESDAKEGHAQATSHPKCDDMSLLPPLATPPNGTDTTKPKIQVISETYY